MKQLYNILFLALVSFVLSTTAGSLYGGETRVVTITDELSPIPGAAIVADYKGPLPLERSGPDAIDQMPGWPVTIGMDPSGMFAPSRGLVFADLNRDGLLEIITSSTDGNIYALDYTGTSMPGFPVVG